VPFDLAVIRFFFRIQKVAIGDLIPATRVKSSCTWPRPYREKQKLEYNMKCIKRDVLDRGW